MGTLKRRVKTNRFGWCEVICENPLTVRFENTGFATKVANPHNLKIGSIRDPLAKVIHGFGFYGDYSLRSKFPKEHDLWKSMITRVFTSKDYANCCICDDWSCLQTFITDIHAMKNWNTKGFQLDKDLRILGNTEYSPFTCSFVPQAINAALTRSSRGKLPSGVSVARNKFHAQITRHGRLEHLGNYDTIEEAREVYLFEKCATLKMYAKEYKNSLHKEVYATLRSITPQLLESSGF